MSSKTIAKTYRFSAGLHSLIVSESEQLKTTEADIVRLALRNYFDERQKQDQLSALEERIIHRLDAQSQRLVKLVQHVITLAQPNAGRSA